MEQILAYLREKYAPLSVIVYGSFADGTNGENSDFDAIVISAMHEVFHDTACVAGTILDVFVYPRSYFEGEIDPDEFLPIFDGKILIDTDGIGEALKAQVCNHFRNRPRKTNAQLCAQLDWCKKMLARAGRGDAEGMFRRHWLIVDSLEIYCDFIGVFYCGPKKTLRWLEQERPQAFALYHNALAERTSQSLSAWIDYMDDIYHKTAGSCD